MLVGAAAGPVLAGAGADGDPEITALLRELDRQRLAGATLLAETVADRLGRTDLDDLRDSLYVLQSPLQYGLIVRDRNRPVRWYRDWVARGLHALG